MRAGKSTAMHPAPFKAPQLISTTALLKWEMYHRALLEQIMRQDRTKYSMKPTKCRCNQLYAVLRFWFRQAVIN